MTPEERATWEGRTSQKLDDISKKIDDLIDNQCSVHSKEIKELQSDMNKGKGMGYILNIISGAIGAILMLLVGKIF